MSLSGRWDAQRYSVREELINIGDVEDTAIAISCDDVYVAGDPGLYLRIPLSGLGPGEAAD